jgi:hypothetical protein
MRAARVGRRLVGDLPHVDEAEPAAGARQLFSERDRVRGAFDVTDTDDDILEHAWQDPGAQGDVSSSGLRDPRSRQGVITRNV